jgi:radical SAM superfamily enzyme YgiQ (UPF0313 family)
VFLGPGEDPWPRFLADFRRGEPMGRYVSRERTLLGAPPLRRDLIDRRRYLCPNSLVVSRGCPHHCDFCYKDAFYQGGKSFYTRAVDEVLAEIERLPGRHLYFLDDHLLGHRRFAATEAGMRSAVIGFETLNPENLWRHATRQNLARDYDQVIRRVHSLGIMVNGSFVFGLDDDNDDVFDRTVEWAIGRSVETATFHIMTPYPGTALHTRLAAEGRITDANWDHYDTRHVVYQPRRLRPEQLLAGYRRAYRAFCRWKAIARGPQVSQPSGRRHGTSRMPAGGSGWSRCGIWSSAPAGSTRCCHCWRPPWTPSVASAGRTAWPLSS